MNFPQLDSTYEDEFGEVDADVYQAGGELWRKQAKHFAVNLLNDADEGCHLMMRAIAEVSRFRKDNPSQIEDLSAYLFTSFKHLVSAKLRQDGNRRRILDKHFRHDREIEETKMLRKIEAAEILQKLNPPEREFFELHYILGYSFEEIAPEFGMKANVLRSKMSKIRDKIRKEIEDNKSNENF